MEVRTANGDLVAIIRNTVEAAATVGVLRVNDAAREIIRNNGYDQAMLTVVVDALCRQCIRRGIVVEFQARDRDQLTA